VLEIRILLHFDTEKQPIKIGIFCAIFCANDDPFWCSVDIGSGLHCRCLVAVDCVFCINAIRTLRFMLFICYKAVIVYKSKIDNVSCFYVLKC